MSKTRGSKEGFVHDSSLTMPTEQRANESNKQKIARIYDMFRAATKDNIAKILQFYDDDEFLVIDALTRDGGKEALSNWADCGSLKSKNNKNKKKKKKAKKDANSALSAAASFDGDDSSSLHSGGNVEADNEKDLPRNDVPIGPLEDAVDERISSECPPSNYERIACNNMEQETRVPVQDSSPHEDEVDIPREVQSPEGASDTTTGPAVQVPTTTCDKSNTESATSCTPPQPDKQSDPAAKREKFRSINEHHSKHSPRQRTNSFRRSKSSSISEESSSQHNAQAAAAPTKRGYDRCRKDLSRQTISLHRIYAQMEKSFEESERKIKNVFTEVQKQFENRQKELEAALEKSKTEAFELLKSRQDLGSDLKRRVDRTPSLTEQEWSTLRSDIKQFVTERKYDDDLGKTIWFQWRDINDVMTIKNYGEVLPVKNVYTQRSQSNAGSSGVSNDANNNADPSPSSSLANEESESTADKNDVGNISDATEETPAVEKDDTAAMNKNQPTEGRAARVFSNKRYNHQGHFPDNRGAGYFREDRNRYQRSNFRNYSYNRHSNYHNNEDYKNQPHHQERDGRVNSGPAFQGDRSTNNYSRDNKMNRSHGRGQTSFRFNNNRSRGRGGPRHNADNPETEPTVKPEKTNAVNGYVDNNENNN